MKEVEKILKDIKREVMAQIILGMRRGSTTLEDAHYLSRDFMEVFSVSNVKDLFLQLGPLAQTYPEIRSPFIKHANGYYNNEKERILKTVPPYIKKGLIEKALFIVRGGIQNE